MYINDTHILVYVIIGLAGILVGQFIDWCNKRMSDYKTVFSKEIFIGIGFNVNEKDFSSDISNIATSLYKETKQVYCRENIICKILENLEIELEKRI